MDDKRSSPEIARSQKIESLIKKVAENKTLARLNTRYAPNSPQNLQVVIKRTFLNPMKIHLYLQVCDGIVRSKLPIFDKTKRQNRNRLPFDQHGFVKVCKNLARCLLLDDTFIYISRPVWRCLTRRPDRSHGGSLYRTICCSSSGGPVGVAVGVAAGAVQRPGTRCRESNVLCVVILLSYIDSIARVGVLIMLCRYLICTKTAPSLPVQQKS